MEKLISVIVPVYILDTQLYDLTKRTLEGLRQYNNLDIIIVDNNSFLDYSEEWMEASDTYIHNSVNYGNGEAWNQGYRLSKGDYVWFCDNDLNFINSNTSSELVKTLDNNDVGVAFPLSKNSDQKDYNSQLSGFCWMTRRDVIEKIGLISLDYGIANFEDTDFYMRCIESGYKLRVNERTKVEHHSRATCDKMPQVAELYEINKQIYERKFGGKYPYASNST